MNRFQMIFMGLLIMGAIFLTVFSQIQMGYAEKEKERANIAERWADENAVKAETNAVEAQKQAAWVAQLRNEKALLKSELEACKAKK